MWSIYLSMWVRSASSYQILQDSKMLILPSGQLRRYKNVVQQTPWMIEEVFEWMYHAAKGANIPPHGWSGGLHHDETKVQKDIVFQMLNGTPTLVGWVDVGAEEMHLKSIRERKVQQTIAIRVLQLSFLGYTGFRFPLCNFPTNGIKASELSIVVWNAIAKLGDWGFQVDYIMQMVEKKTGNSQNSILIKVQSPFVTLAQAWLTKPEQFIMYRIFRTMWRNNILSSGDNPKSTRKLTHKD